MVALSHLIFDYLSHSDETCTSDSGQFTGIPVVDLSKPDEARVIMVKACMELGFFKVINHGFSMDFLNRLEDEAAEFFRLPQSEKDKSGPPNPFGYGNKKTGPNGDVGWVEYLLFCTNSELISHNSNAIIPGISQSLRSMVNEYVSSVRNMTCRVLEMIADELQIQPRDTLSNLIRNSKSDSCFRLNHYPPLPPQLSHQSSAGTGKVIGFGEHTDPQIISVLRSNNTSGLELCRRNGTWVPVSPDNTSFFFNVGDSLQVMTNDRFLSAKHRVVVADSCLDSRVSMIYFGGPPLDEKVTALPSLLERGEERKYEEFTWSEYKKCAYKTRLGDNRLKLFQRSEIISSSKFINTLDSQT